MYSLPLPTRFAQSPKNTDGNRALSLDWDRIKQQSKPEQTNSTSSWPQGHQHSGYPSPPMSETPSPGRRLEQSHRAESEELRQRQLQHQQQQPLIPPTAAPAPAPAPPPPPHARSAAPQQRALPPAEYAQQPARAMIQYQPSAELPATYRFDFTPVGVSPLPGLVGASGVPAQVGSTQFESSPAASRAATSNKPMRRTKAHVASACVNCKKAHLSCDAKRPCSRCVAAGKEDSCYDVPHKKRGRPRLRDDRDSKAALERQASDKTSRFLPMPTGVAAIAAPAPRSFRESPTAGQPYVPQMQRFPAQEEHLLPQAERPYPSYYAAPPPPPSTIDISSLPVAFLNLDLAIIKANQLLQDLIGRQSDIAGRNVTDLAEPSAKDSIEKLCRDLRDERDALVPNYMPPLRSEEFDAINALSDADIPVVSRSFLDHQVSWGFRLAGRADYCSLQVRIRLARTRNVFFATMVVESHPPTTSLLSAAYVPPPSASSSHYSGSPPVSVVTSSGGSDYPHFTPPSGPSSPFSQALYQPAPSRGSSSPATQPRHFGQPAPPSRHSRGGLLQQQQHQQRPPTPPPTSVPKFVSTTSGPTPSSRPTSASSEATTSSALRRQSGATPFEGIQLPPIRNLPPPNQSQQVHPTPSSLPPNDSGLIRRDSGSSSRERTRRRDELDVSPPVEGPQQSRDQGEQGQKDSSKRRRLNIHEVLD